MARSETSKERKRPRTLYTVTIALAVGLVAIALIAFYLPPANPLVQNFSLEFSIQLYNATTTSVQYVFPDLAVGMRGGYWISHVYDTYGLSGVSPVYSRDPSSVYQPGVYPGYTTIYVKSTSNRTYYLGDYFSIWGESLGRNNTVGYTTPPQSNVFPSTWSWHMCVGPTQGSQRAGLWGKEPLVPNMRITLAYEDEAPCIGG